MLVALAGDVPRVDGQLAVARAFGDKSLKRHLSSEPDTAIEIIDDDVEFVILASDGLWKVGLSRTLPNILPSFRILSLI
ncbi:probable protein phosphatase 2c 62 [Phtheirospermum japonicum]|uniref:Probable protein phosphatase 2c 62 n=1 Tax=Phtheirospermum japonicum TaxID=374723 RepID=A0A830DDP8_9LAMI|nr:probable protein phosphatase 2c 62 [Phtheirospermum japonicum]